MSGILDLFVPKDKKFFEYLNKQIVLLNEASKILDAFVSKEYDKKRLDKYLKRIKANSLEVDEISLEITNTLHKTFITPIDRDEIKSLSTNIALIIDSFEKIITSISYLEIKRLDNNFLKQVELLQKAVKSLEFLFVEPLSAKRNRETLQKINLLEKEADGLYRRAIGELFTKKKNAIEILKSRELYDVVENAIDDIRVTSDILETIIINNS